VNSLNLLLASQFNISGFCSVIDFSLIFIWRCLSCSVWWLCE
jgi:hypothetical protein